MKTTKPRLGDTADELWQAVRDLQPQVLREAGSRLVHPTLRVVLGQDYRWDGSRLLIIHGGDWPGMCERAATQQEAQSFHDDLDQDRVQVAFLTPPGYASGYGPQRVLREVHSPSGLAFECRVRPAHRSPA